MTISSNKLVILAILDGWGIAPDSPGNAITQSSTPNMSMFQKKYPNTTLTASGEFVGLPRGEDGNTETGHLNIGAGLVVYQDLERISMSIAEGSFFSNEVLNKALDHAIQFNSNLHLIGLLGAGGVHSKIEHLFALLRLAKTKDFKNVFVHVFTDGRDTPPTSANIYIAKLNEVIKKEGVGKIASVIGRYWAMDRNERWSRTAKAYFALTKGAGRLVKSTNEAIKSSYQTGITDEFIEPSLVAEDEKPIALIKENDAVIFFNFRIDRPRQLTKAFLLDDMKMAAKEKGFDPHLVEYEQTHISKKNNKLDEPFDRGEKIKNLYFVGMTEYDKPLVETGLKVAFPPIMVDNPLGKVISDANLNQLRITESEKERFVTFYFNGLREQPFPNEDRIIIPSPDVATYDLKPEMSSHEITDTLIRKMQEKNYSLAVINYPNADMIGHTGSIGPAVRAIEAVDKQLGKLAGFAYSYDATLIITSDHGNAEEMIDLSTGAISTDHTANKVPLIIVSNKFQDRKIDLKPGILSDIAPTILSILDLKIPKEMTGRNLLEPV